MSIEAELEINEGDILRIKPTRQIIKVVTVKMLSKGKVTVQYQYKDEFGILQKSEMYWEVLMLMGVEKEKDT